MSDPHSALCGYASWPRPSSPVLESFPRASGQNTLALSLGQHPPSHGPSMAPGPTVPQWGADAWPSLQSAKHMFPSCPHVVPLARPADPEGTEGTLLPVALPHAHRSPGGCVHREHLQTGRGQPFPTSPTSLTLCLHHSGDPRCRPLTVAGRARDPCSPLRYSASAYEPPT